jgi:hypothetical protein
MSQKSSLMQRPQYVPGPLTLDSAAVLVLPANWFSQAVDLDPTSFGGHLLPGEASPLERRAEFNQAGGERRGRTEARAGGNIRRAGEVNSMNIP